MSCYTIYYKDGAKMMRPVLTRKEYLQLRDSSAQKAMVRQVRNGNGNAKMRLLQCNYSCIPSTNDNDALRYDDDNCHAECGPLKGCSTPSNSVGMDVDHIAKEQMEEVKERILAKKDELGLLMLELSARGEGYHLVFKRKAELSQEDNLRWASDLLGVEFDKGAKDITRVFFTTTASEEDLLFLDDGLFTTVAIEIEANTNPTNDTNEVVEAKKDSVDSDNSCSKEKYHDIPYSVIIAKYWEMFNDGREPSEGDRNVKTYELAMTLRPICDYDQGMMERVIPQYDGFPEDEWRKTITNALNEPRKSMPYRLRQVLTAVKNDRKMAIIGAPSDSPKGEDRMPERPRRMPDVLKLLSSKVPMKYKAMVEEAVWPAICAHLKGVTFRYVDGVIHEANISSPLIGRQSSGKGAVNMPIEFLLADITAKDKENESRLLDWRRRNQGKGLRRIVSHDRRTS